MCQIQVRLDEQGRKRGSKMEELKKENEMEQPVAEEQVVEQRPSTKYGRTAYQQQMQEELAVQEQQNDWQEQNPYNQQAYSAYTPYEEAKMEVKSTYVYILMAVIAITQIVSFAVNVIASRAYSMGETIEEIIDATLLIAQEPSMLILSTISDLLFWITVVFMVLDIIQLYKAGKKIGGAIAFAIFLRPAYFIWRAHLLGQKKTVPIVYAVIVYMVSFAQYFVLMSASMDMVMRTMY